MNDTMKANVALNDSALGLDFLALHPDIMRLLRDHFTSEERGQVLDWVFAYVLDGNLPDLDDAPRDLKIMFLLIQSRVDAAVQRKKESAEASRENGKKGGRPRKNATQAVEPDADQSTNVESSDDLNTSSGYKVPCTDGEYVFTLGEIKRFEECYPAVNVRDQLERLNDHLLKQPEKQTCKADLPAYARNWIARGTTARPTPAAPKADKGGMTQCKM